jgi:hypothetical protein
MLFVATTKLHALFVSIPGAWSEPSPVFSRNTLFAALEAVSAATVLGYVFVWSPSNEL